MSLIRELLRAYSACMATTTFSPAAQRVLLDAEQVGALLAISVRHVWSLHSQGKLPSPLRLGKATRWRESELLQWLENGAPSRDQWEGRRK
jgi:predicted DNA-binding transcriptional regulator AlpA